MSSAFPNPPVSLPFGQGRPPSGATAELLVLIALILQVIGGVILFVALAALLGATLLFAFPFAGAAFVAIGSIAGIVVLFLYLAYTFSFQRIQRREYAGARAPTLVIGILSLFAGVLPGIFYLIAYAKLGDAIREQQAPPSAGALIACKGCGRVYPIGPVTFCPICGQRLGP